MSPVVSNWVRYPLIALLLLVAITLPWTRRNRRSPFVALVDSLYLRLWLSFGPRGIVLSVLGWLFIGLVVAAATGGGLLWMLGWPRLPPTSAFSVTEMLDLLKIALAVVAGFGGVVLLAVNFRKQRITEAEHDLAVERGTRDEVQRFNERFGAAAEQLAHEKAAVRLAGVYAMAGLADDWENKRQTCVDVLCGYFRMQEDDNENWAEAEVRNAILSMIRERIGKFGDAPWREVDFDFTGVEFEDAEFTGLRFGGRVTFDGARFSGELTAMDQTFFEGGLSCHGTKFLAKRTTFSSASIELGAEFVGAEFVSELVDFSYVQMKGADFYRVKFTSKRVSFSWCDVIGGALRFDQCEFGDFELDLSSTYRSDRGRLMIDRCRFLRGSMVFDVSTPAPVFYWLTRSRFEGVEFKIDDYRDADDQPWLNVRDEELVDTVLPAKHVRRPTVDPV